MKITSRELLPGDIKVADLRLVKLKPGETLFVRIDVGHLDEQSAVECLEMVQDFIEPMFPDNIVQTVSTAVDFEVGP